MNRRIFKKLTKKAEPLIIQLGLVKNQSRVVVQGGWDNEPLESMFSDWDDIQLKGTVGYGCVEGYYEPEWSDSDCYSILYSFVIDHFCNWGKAEPGEYPNCDWPNSKKRTPKNIFKVARFLAAHYKANPKKVIYLESIPEAA